MTDSHRIREQEVEPLPRWARLAFAARCLRRARGLVHIPGEPARILDGALAAIEQAASTGQAGDELADAAAGAYRLALDNLDSRAAPPESAEEEVLVACMVAHATAFAAEAATLPEGRPAAHLIAQSVDFAVHAFRVARAPDTGEVVVAMRADLQRLREAAERGGWDDRTPVRADIVP